MIKDSLFFDVTTFFINFRKFTDVFVIHLNILEFWDSSNRRLSFEEISDINITVLLVRKVVVALDQRTFVEGHKEVTESSSDHVSVVTFEGGQRSVRAWNWSLSLGSWPVLLESSNINFDLLALTGSGFHKNDNSIVHHMA